jgi:hypothetical protein
VNYYNLKVRSRICERGKVKDLKNGSCGSACRVGARWGRLGRIVLLSHS